MNPPASSFSGEVRHNLAERRFEIVVDDLLSEADYELADGRMILTHTYVPPALRGRGLAEKVVRAALDYARQENLKIVPACSYVQVFIERNSEYKSLME